jgi:hypothetical protein
VRRSWVACRAENAARSAQTFPDAAQNVAPAAGGISSHLAEIDTAVLRESNTPRLLDPERRTGNAARREP